MNDGTEQNEKQEKISLQEFKEKHKWLTEKMNYTNVNCVRYFKRIYGIEENEFEELCEKAK